MSKNPHILTPSDMQQRLEQKIHPLNGDAIRSAVSLGDITGLSRVGLHYTVLDPGRTSTVQHSHDFGDEFILILSGQGTLCLDNESHEINAGDFIGLPAKGPSHAIKNSGTTNLVYIVGGDRPDFDICHYPHLGKRVYLYFNESSRARDFVDDSAIMTK